jgi:hypothetical protein
MGRSEAVRGRRERALKAGPREGEHRRRDNRQVVILLLLGVLVVALWSIS